MGVPESGVPAAEGYARASGIPHGQGLVKNRYIGRTFITPGAAERAAGVRRKLNPLRDNVAGKRLVVVDDSIVRGTTQRAVVGMLREAGAAEVHLRISSPPLVWPCFYGIDIPDRDELVASDSSIAELERFLGVDSLEYLSLENLIEAIGAPGAGFCTGVSDRGVPGSGPGPARRPRRARRRASPPVDRRSAGAGRLSATSYAAPRATPRPESISKLPIEAVSRIAALVASTSRPEVLGGIGGFGGSFALDIARMTAPVLVASTDGVGTKLAVAQAAGRFETVGVDLVAMCVDDLVCVGAEPLFMLDYISTGRLDPDQVEALVGGVADGCRQAGCALLGGEIAEHPAGDRRPATLRHGRVRGGRRRTRRHARTRERRRRGRTFRAAVAGAAVQRLLARRATSFSSVPVDPWTARRGTARGSRLPTSCCAPRSSIRPPVLGRWRGPAPSTRRPT